MRALLSLATFVSSALLGAALADTLAGTLPGTLAGILGVGAARALVPFASKLQSEDVPREGQ